MNILNVLTPAIVKDSFINDYVYFVGHEIHSFLFYNNIFNTNTYFKNKPEAEILKRI